AAAREGGGGGDQLRAQPLAAHVLAQEEAGDRPDGASVDRREDARAGEEAVLGARRDRDPRHRLAAAIGEQSGRRAALDEPLHRALVLLALARLVLAPRESRRHAP